MTQGIAKNASDHLKSQAKKLGLSLNNIFLITGGKVMVNVQSDGGGDITNEVSTVAQNYETALNGLLTQAGTGTMDISDATVNTTQVQQGRQY